MKFNETKNRSEEIFKDIDKLERRNGTIREASVQLWAIRQNCKTIVNNYNKLLKKYNESQNNENSQISIGCLHKMIAELNYKVWKLECVWLKYEYDKSRCREDFNGQSFEEFCKAEWECSN